MQNIHFSAPETPAGEELDPGISSFSAYAKKQALTSARISRRYPKGPCTQYLGTWVLDYSNYSIGFG